MSDVLTRRKHEYFMDEAGADALDAAFLRLVAERQKQVVASYMSPDSTLALRHRGAWIHPGAPEAITGAPQQHSATIETPFQGLIDNDLGIIRRNVQSLVEALHRQFAGMIYSTVSSVCEQTGNTVDARAAGSIENALLEMMEKIELTANGRGEVALPDMHVGPEVGARMKEALANPSPEFQRRFDDLVKRKTEVAQAREAERKAKFARYGDSQ